MSELLTLSEKGQFTDTLICRKPVDFFSLRGCLGKVEIPENEEELFCGAVAKHVLEKS